MKRTRPDAAEFSEPGSTGKSLTAYGRPITRTFTLPEQIAHRLADAIVAGHYAPGARISEQELADLFGVSRGPIRDALRILEKEGLVTILPRRGTVVTKLTSGEVEEIFQIRATLMGLAARLTAGHRRPQVVTEMLSASARLEYLARRADDVDEFVRTVYQMSTFVTEASLSDRLKNMVLSMSRQTLALSRRALADKENRKIWARNFKILAAAVKAGDPDAAEKAARRLVHDTGQMARRQAEIGENISHDARPLSA